MAHVKRFATTLESNCTLTEGSSMDLDSGQLRRSSTTFSSLTLGSLRDRHVKPLSTSSPLFDRGNGIETPVHGNKAPAPLILSEADSLRPLSQPEEKSVEVGLDSPESSSIKPPTAVAYYRSELTDLYTTYCPEELANLDVTLRQYEGREAALVTEVLKKYEGPLHSAHIRERVEALYRAYAPHRLSRVNQVLVNYRGRERELITVLVQKYGPEPTKPPAAAAADGASSQPSSLKTSTYRTAASTMKATQKAPLMGRKASLEKAAPAPRSSSKSGANHKSVRTIVKEFATALGTSEERAGIDTLLDIATARLLIYKATGTVDHSKATPDVISALSALPPISVHPDHLVEILLELVQPPNISQEEVQVAVGRMKQFTKACHVTAAAPPTPDRDGEALSFGFWVHRCVFPSTLPLWTRCWVMLDNNALRVCRRGSTRVEWHIPFHSIHRCHLQAMLHCNAPSNFARNGIVVELNSPADNNLNCRMGLHLCPEKMCHSQAVVKAFRLWSQLQETQLSVSCRDSGARSHFSTMRRATVWSCCDGRTVYLCESWRFEGSFLLHSVIGGEEGSSVWCLNQVQDVTLIEQVPGAPPLKFVKFCFVVRLRTGNCIFCCAESKKERRWVVEQLRRRLLLCAVAHEGPLEVGGIHQERMPGVTPVKIQSTPPKRAVSADRDPHRSSAGGRATEANRYLRYKSDDE